jgi:hypothetical protein
MSLAESLEEAAEALPADADAIRPANGDPRLLLDGLDAGAATRVLSWLLGNAPEAGEELAGAWLEEEAGVVALGALDEASLPKAGRKVVRRILHRARSRGLVVDGAAESASPKVARLPKVDADLGAAYVSSHDPRGGRLVYLVESVASGGARVFEALLDVERGIVDFQVYRAGRSQVRDFVRDVTRRERFGAVAAEPASVRALITLHTERHPADRPFPKAFAEWRGRVGRAAEPEAEPAATPGALVREALAAEPSDDDVRALRDRVEAREFGPWPPAPELLEGVMSELVDAETEVTTEQRLERLEEAVRALYSDEAVAANAERLEESAYVYWKSGEEGLAKACLATADALRGGQSSGHPVVEAMANIVTVALGDDLKQRLGSQDEGSESDPAEDKNEE